jgi:hypothetical protein
MRTVLLIHERDNQPAILHYPGVKCELCERREPIVRVTFENGIVIKHFGYEREKETV